MLGIAARTDCQIGRRYKLHCFYCDKETSLTQLIFVPDGMVPETQIKRSRAQCVECRKKLPMDRTSKHRPPEQTNAEREPGEDDDLEYDQGHAF